MCIVSAYTQERVWIYFMVCFYFAILIPPMWCAYSMAVKRVYQLERDLNKTIPNTVTPIVYALQLLDEIKSNKSLF